MANDDSKKVKELLEIINNKVGKIKMRQSLQTPQLSLMKNQQSVINEKLDDISSDVTGLKKDMKELREDVDAARGDIETIRMDVTWIKEKQEMSHSRDKREIDEIKTHLGLPLMPDTPEEMQAFIDEYTQLLVTKGEDEECRTNPRRVAMSNIGYATVLIGPDAIRQWSDVFGSLPHPYFGDIRNVPVDGEASYVIGQADQIIKEGN